MVVSFRVEVSPLDPQYLWIVQASQSASDVAPVVAAAINVPTGQVLGTAEPGSPELPSGQYEPDGQVIPETEPLGQYYPAGHLIVSVITVMPSVAHTYPSGHEMQSEIYLAPKYGI
jgi:hypothetical protein